MKKLLYMASVFALMFTSCDPMEDAYEELDNIKEAYTQEVEHTFSDEDYVALSAIAVEVAKTDEEKKDAESIGKYKNFSSYVPAEKYIPMFLADKYATLETGSVADVTYKFYQGGLSYLRDYLQYLEELESIEAYELTSEDYDSMGEESGQPGKYDNFSESTPAADYLPDFLLAKYPDAQSGDELSITYKYYNGSVSNVIEFWSFDGSVWTKSTKEAPVVPDDVVVYELTADDYDSMGAPGEHDNFSSSDPAENYLPVFLKQKYAYAGNGEKVVVIYRYYKGKIDGQHVTVTEGKEYTFDGTEWIEYVSTIEKSGQYILTKDGWVFDPTVIFTMVSADYQIVVDYSKATHGKTSDYDDSEYYYGASAKYSNFDLRLKNRNTEDYAMPAFDGLSKEEAVALTYTRMMEGVKVMLTQKYPEAVAQVSGVDVFYEVTVKTYEEDLTSKSYTLKFQCTKSGPNPEFTYIEGLPE